MQAPHPVPLLRDRSFLSLVATQFLGAFNDNAFKQMIALIAVGLTLKSGGISIQAVALALFALPFVLFCGLAGMLADRYSKTHIVLVSKIAEVAVMGLGLVGFATGSLPLLLVTLFLMGAQSNFFAPAKYGILPEMLPESHLPRANGLMLMTTFLAIILGTASAGWLLHQFPGRLQFGGIFCIGLALLGTLTATGLRWVRPAVPDLAIPRHPLGDLPSVLRWMARDADFRLIVVTNSLFWFIGGVVQQTMNRYGKGLMRLDDAQTSLLLVSLSAGIAAGSLAGGLLSGRRLDFRVCSYGLVGLALGLGGLVVAHHRLWAAHVAVAVLGAGGGMFGLPLQTYIQLRPPPGEKGRAVAATSFVNWIFIFGSAAFYGTAVALVPVNWIPGLLLVLVLALLVWLPGRLARVVY